MKFIVYDTEYFPLSGHCELLQLSYVVYDENYQLIKENSSYISTDVDFPENSCAFAVNGITKELIEKNGLDLEMVVKEFVSNVDSDDIVIGHNVNNDFTCIRRTLNYHNKDFDCLFPRSQQVCTRTMAPKFYYDLKDYKLGTVYKHLSGNDIENQHDALADAKATAFIFFKILDLIKSNYHNQPADQCQYKFITGTMKGKYCRAPTKTALCKSCQRSTRFPFEKFTKNTPIKLTKCPKRDESGFYDYKKPTEKLIDTINEVPIPKNNNTNNVFHGIYSTKIIVGKKRYF